MLKSNHKYSQEINCIYKENRKKKFIDRKKEGHGLRCWARNWPKQWIFEVENGCTFRYGKIVIFFFFFFFEKETLLYLLKASFSQVVGPSNNLGK